MPVTPRIATIWALQIVPLALAATLSAAPGPAELAKAARNRDMTAVRALLAKGADVNAAEADGATPLHWAAHWDDLAVADLLLAKGARADAANDYGVTPLSLAATNGSAPMVLKLLKAGANANTTLPSGETVLMIAARTGKVDGVASLIEGGAQIDAVEAGKGQTALMWAAAEGHAPLVKLLIERGANVSARSKAGYTPLILAARGGDVSTAQVLLDAKANVNDAAKDGTAPLILSLVRGHVELAKYLLERGADPNADGRGFNALHWVSGSWDGQMHFGQHSEGMLTEWHALTGLRGQRKLDMMKALLAHGAKVNATNTKSPPRFGFLAGSVALEGATPFLIAACAADIDAMKLLLAAGADKDRTTDNQFTALMLAAGVCRIPGQDQVVEAQALEAVKFVWGLGGFDVNAASDENWTSMHGAAYWGSIELTKFLVEHGAELEIETYDKIATPLSIAEGRTPFRGMNTYNYPELAVALRQLGAKK